LTDWFRGLITPRELLNLIRFLPIDSAFARGIAGGSDMAAWTATDYLLAHMIDAYMAVNFKDVKPYPRPMDVMKERQFNESRRVALEAQRERQRAREQERALRAV
jgi:hypothetical protein